MTGLIRSELLQIIEMINTMNYAVENYPRVASTLKEEEKQLIKDIKNAIDKNKVNTEKYDVPITSSSIN